MIWPPRAIVRRDLGLWALESALHRRGFGSVAGVDEAGRGACAGPMVVAACVLPSGPRGRVPGLHDSKLLTPGARERVYAQVRRRALAWSVVTIPAARIDARGLHVCNVEGMRRAVMALDLPADYVLTDGFSVPGLPVPSLAVWKGDRTAACVAAASVLAKVTRDRMMTDLHKRYPAYDFDVHKGYVTRRHAEALDRHGPCAEHRRSYSNVAASMPAGPPVKAVRLGVAGRGGADRAGGVGGDTAADVAATVAAMGQDVTMSVAATVAPEVTSDGRI